MILVLSIVLSLVLVPLLLPAASDLVTIFRRRRRLQAVPNEEARLLFLVPAHNEQLIIAECIRALVGMRYPRSRIRIVVIADNCNDETAKISRENGAEVLERTNRDLPGKPRAIAWALEQFDLDAFDACVIVDADTSVDPAFASALSAFMPLSSRAVQAYYATRNEYENWLTRLAGVLARCRYEVTYPVRMAAGLNCPMTGNGMCLGVELLKNGGWQAFSLTENWELYASYTANGVPIAYARDAILYSQEVRSLNQGGIQRRRWLAGRLWVLRQWWKPILRSSKIGWRQKLDTIAELAAASPVLHLAIGIGIVTLALGVIRGTTGLVLTLGVAASLLPLVLATLVVVIRHPQPWKTVAAFFMLPIYAVWRVLTALRTILFPPEKVWKKTERHRDLPSVP